MGQRVVLTRKAGSGLAYRERDVLSGGEAVVSPGLRSLIGRTPRGHDAMEGITRQAQARRDNYSAVVAARSLIGSQYTHQK